MNNYEAIEWMEVKKQCVIECPDEPNDASKEMIEAYNMAIEALENQNDCKDCTGCTQWLCDCSNVKNEVCDRIIEQLEGLVQYNRNEMLRYSGRHDITNPIGYQTRGVEIAIEVVKDILKEDAK